MKVIASRGSILNVSSGGECSADGGGRHGIVADELSVSDEAVNDEDVVDGGEERRLGVQCNARVARAGWK